MGTGSCAEVEQCNEYVERGNCGGGSDDSCCCDENCLYYGDCCDDYADSCDESIDYVRVLQGIKEEDRFGEDEDQDLTEDFLVAGDGASSVILACVSGTIYAIGAAGTTVGVAVANAGGIATGPGEVPVAVESVATLAFAGGLVTLAVGEWQTCFQPLAKVAAAIYAQGTDQALSFVRGVEEFIHFFPAQFKYTRGECTCYSCPAGATVEGRQSSPLDPPSKSHDDCDEAVKAACRICTDAGCLARSRGCR